MQNWRKEEYDWKREDDKWERARETLVVESPRRKSPPTANNENGTPRYGQSIAGVQ